MSENGTAPRAISAIVSIFVAGIFSACPSADKQDKVHTSPTPVVVADRFAYPVGGTEKITEARDSADGWYNAQDLGENEHLGEDWNANSGGNTDCGEPVLATGSGRIAFAGEAGPGWGKVIIIDHRLPDGSLVQSLYGHLRTIERRTGEVSIGEKVGSVGDADGKYPCHLHFEIRDASCPVWGKPGPGYSRQADGWLDPSDFIDSRNAVSGQAGSGR